MKQGFILLFCFLFLLSKSSLSSTAGIGEAAFFALEDQIVISGSKREQKTSEIPVPIYVITEQDILESNAHSIAELLEGTPGLYLSRMTATQYEVGIRGGLNLPYGKMPDSITTENLQWGGAMDTLISKQLLVLVDGRSVYIPAYGGVVWDALPITLGEIERIEIARGPATVLFGTNAFMGVINIITKNPKEYKEFHARGLGGYPVGVVESCYLGNWKKLSYSASMGVHYKHKYDTADWIDPSKHTRAYFHHYSSLSRPQDINKHPLPLASRKAAGYTAKTRVKAQYDYTKDMNASLEYGFNYTNHVFLGGENQLRKVSSYNRTHYTKLDYNFDTDTHVKFTFTKSKNSMMSLRYYDMQSTEYMFEAQRTFHPFENNDFLFGYTYDFYGIVSEMNNGSDKRQYHALYWQNQLRLLDKKFLILLGGRMDHLIPSGTWYTHQHAMMYNFTKNRSVRFLFSQALRTPMMTALFYDSHQNSYQDFTANGQVYEKDLKHEVYGKPDLNPMKINNFEAGFRDKILDNKLEYDVAAFYYFITSPIITNIESIKMPISADIPPYALSLTFANGDGKVSGFGGEIYARWILSKNTKLNVNYSMIFTKDHDAGKFVSATPQHLINIGVKQRFLKNFMVHVWLNMMSGSEVNYSLVNGTFASATLPAVIIPNLTLSYSMLNDSLVAMVTAKNMFHKKVRYNPYGSAFGGTYYASLNFKY